MLSTAITYNCWGNSIGLQNTFFKSIGAVNRLLSGTICHVTVCDSGVAKTRRPRGKEGRWGDLGSRSPRVKSPEQSLWWELVSRPPKYLNSSFNLAWNLHSIADSDTGKQPRAPPNLSTVLSFSSLVSRQCSWPGRIGLETRSLKVVCTYTLT